MRTRLVFAETVTYMLAMQHRMEDIQNYEAVQVLGACAYRKFNAAEALGVFSDLMHTHKS